MARTFVARIIGLQSQRLWIAALAVAALAKITFAQAIPPPIPLTPAQPFSNPIANPQATVIVGDPTVADNPNAFDAINDNTPDSPLAGVVSVYGAANSTTGYLGTGVAIDSTHILTAAHVVDFSGGLTPEGTVTGDGTADALIPDSRIYLNNIAAPSSIPIASIQLAPGWTGFRNANAPGGASSLNDLAILTLQSPLPPSVPTYSIYRTPFATDTAKVILFSGYGGGGDEVNGITQPASFDIKRFGWNVAGVYDSAPGSTVAAQFLSDFDPPAADGSPDPTQTGFDGITSLGNDYEATIAPGDSGGPAFLVDDLNGDGIVEANELTIFGLTTFTFDTSNGAWPSFGSGFGGTILSAYSGFIDAAIAPEPASLLLFLAAGPLLLRRRRVRN